jgi:NitT/TauT family transport system substrate-binding protein
VERLNRRNPGRRNRPLSESPVAFDTLRIPAVAYADVQDRMPSVQEKPIVRIAPNNPVFDLPVIVGIEERLFEAAGLDVAFSATYADREKDQAERPIMSRLKEHLFESGSADSYNVCEWASIDRLERGTRAGHIAALRAAVAAQAILTFDESLQVPRDLAGVPVVVQELTGSHYCTLQMLESAVGPEKVTIESGGLPQVRWAALKNGAIRVATLMEPFVSLGLKEGAHVIAACFYRGGEVISPRLTAEQRTAYYAAENAAVDRINADFYKYAHHVTAHASGALQPHELLRAFVRYKHVDYYDPVLFARTYEWMKSRGLTEGGSDHASLIVG